MLMSLGIQVLEYRRGLGVLMPGPSRIGMQLALRDSG